MAEEKVQVAGPRTATRGAQVRITGEAQEAARGGMGGDIVDNLVAKRALEADGSVPDGLSPDGTTQSGAPPADEVVTREGEPSGEVPAAEGTTRVEVKEPAAAPDPQTTAPPPPKPAPAPAPAAKG